MQLPLERLRKAVEGFLETADKALRRGYDRFELCALEYANDCYKAAGRAECKKSVELKERIAGLKKKLASQTF